MMYKKQTFAATLVLCLVLVACKNNDSGFESVPAADKSTPGIFVAENAPGNNESTLKEDNFMPAITPDDRNKIASVGGSATESEYIELYDDLITEWKSALSRHANNEYTENEIFDFGFYSGYADPLKTYYALYDIDGNGIKELLLKKQTEGEDIIAYIFTIKDGAPINLFGYNDEGLPREVPWSRVGSSRILDNGLIDCYYGDYTIYKIAENGYSVIKLASAEPYDYPDEANKAEAKWRFYINELEADYDFYVQYLSEQGYTVNGNNTLANIDWEIIN